MGIRLRRLKSVVLLNPILVELLPQRVPMQAELTGRGRALPEFMRQRGVQEWRFDEAQEAFVEVFSFAVFSQTSGGPLLNELRERRGWCPVRRNACGWSRRRELIRFDLSAASDDDGVLDCVALADVAVPRATG